MTAYDVLGATPSSSTAQLRRSYLAAVRAAHPDHASDPADRERRTQRTAQLNGAWSVLRDPVARATYDAELNLRRRAAASAASTTTPRPSRAAAAPAPEPVQPHPASRAEPAPAWAAGIGAWALLALVALLALGPFAWLSAGSYFAHVGNWVLVAGAFQFVAARSASPLAILLRLALRGGMTMLRSDGSTDSLRHSWSATQR